jgi:hypothetical protein
MGNRVKKITATSYRIFLCGILLAVCFLCASCKDNPDDDSEIAEARRITFSHDSGVYSRSFDLTLAAPEGSKVYYSTDGSEPLPSKVKSGGPVFEYTGGSITVKDRNGQPNVLATRENTAQFYMKPGDPRESAPGEYYASAEQVPKATVIRALAVDSKGKQGETLTRTYFIGDNLKNYGNHPVLSIVTDPQNLLDEKTGIYVRGPGNKWPDYNFNKKGRDWERPANLDFFDGDRKVAFSTGVGIRIRGGWSRDRGQKSFNVYFREEYPGIKNLANYPLIPGAVKADGKTPVTKFKNFMLRNGGNDTEYTKFYDVFVQSLVSDRKFTTQAAIPCVLYLNGEYWGPYNLQEKYSDNYLEYKFGVNKDNVMSFESGELDEGIASDWQFYNELMSYKDKDMTIPSNYAAFCALFDIQSYIDYFAAQIYVYNEDWPQNNFQLWRVRNVEPGNPYGDGKWRWMMFDTEFSMGIYNSGGLTGQSGKDPFDKILNGENKNHPNNVLFAQLLKNATFRSQFASTMREIMNNNFEYNAASAKLTAIAAVYKPLMDGYYERWGQPWPTVFDNKVSEARKYLNDIRTKMPGYLSKYCPD